jgi:hypothetical protein
VYGITADSMGNMWIATGGGALQNMMAPPFLFMTAEMDCLEIPSSKLQKIMQDKSGLQLAMHGVSRYDGSSFHPLQH